MLLKKGLEVEVYTGTFQGDIVGFSDKIVKALPGFVCEPDTRNVEYMTQPFSSYERLLGELVCPRLHLRCYLKTLGDYTIVPGSSLSLGDSKVFFRSTPNNLYHSFIENTYHTKVVTTSVHINIGMDNPENIIKACRLLRLEAPVFLALSAASPFLDNKPTGFHSTRWEQFPKTHNNVPLFVDHKHYIKWTEDQLQAKTMKNVRHLWTAARPNGDNRPYDINRFELRICDLISNPKQLLAVTALVEARVLQLLEDESLDPVNMPGFAEKESILLKNIVENEYRASCHSLDAKLLHWRDGNEILAKDWAQKIYEETLPIAEKNGFGQYLQPVQDILQEGNQAQKWIKSFESGKDIRQIIIEAIDQMIVEDVELQKNLCCR